MQRLANGRNVHPGDWSAVRRFKASNSSVFGGVRFETNKIVLAVTRLVPEVEHLKSELHKPGELEIITVSRNEEQAKEIALNVQVALRPHRRVVQHLSVTAVASVELSVSAEGATIAERLWRDWGSALNLTVAGRAYPPTERDNWTNPQVSRSESRQLTVKTLTAPSSVRSGSSLEGTVALCNSDTVPITVSIETPSLAFLLDHDGVRQGQYSESMMGNVITTTLPAGSEIAINFLGGTESVIFPNLTAAGQYDLVVRVALTLVARDRHRRQNMLQTSPVAVRVTD